MKFIYTSNKCPKCDELKKRYDEFGIPYIERIADRIRSPEDAIDFLALIQASVQNMTLPVEVEA